MKRLKLERKTGKNTRNDRGIKYARKKFRKVERSN